MPMDGLPPVESSPVAFAEHQAEVGSMFHTRFIAIPVCFRVSPASTAAVYTGLHIESIHRKVFEVGF
jgi:hypothetical protein